jgi:hypothetical protein
MYGVTASNLAEVYLSQSRNVKAQYWLKAASTALGRALGKGDPVVQAVENRYQTLLNEQSPKKRESDN